MAATGEALPGWRARGRDTTRAGGSGCPRGLRRVCPLVSLNASPPANPLGHSSRRTFAAWTPPSSDHRPLVLAVDYEPPARPPAGLARSLSCAGGGGRARRVGFAKNCRSQVAAVVMGSCRVTQEALPQALLDTLTQMLSSSIVRVPRIRRRSCPRRLVRKVQLVLANQPHLP